MREGPLGIPLKLFALIALVAITNTALVTLVAQARIMYGMAKQGAFPRIFARCHRTRRTPWVAILFTSAAAIVLILVAPVDDLATVTSLFLIAVFGLVCVSALMLRSESVEHDHYVAPTWVLLTGVVANAGLLGYTLYDSWSDLWVYVVGIMAAGLVLYFVNMATKPAADRRIEVEKARGTAGLTSHSGAGSRPRARTAITWSRSRICGSGSSELCGVEFTSPKVACTSAWASLRLSPGRTARSWSAQSRT